MSPEDALRRIISIIESVPSNERSLVINTLEVVLVQLRMDAERK
jgi:hypothetical protein